MYENSGYVARNWAEANGVKWLGLASCLTMLHQWKRIVSSGSIFKVAPDTGPAFHGKKKKDICTVPVYFMRLADMKIQSIITTIHF